MWRRTYLGLILLRLYFATCPSYLHPDEHFQGPEVIAGQVLGFPAKLTWEFSSDAPIRSIFPLWLVYGWPMTLLHWLCDGLGYHVRPDVVYYALRLVMFTLSFIVEDWALHELLPNPKQRRVGIILVASSYVTWTWQTHTFSNSIETITVLWCLVLIQRIQDDKKSSQLVSSAILGLLTVFGTFTRITFPAFLAIPLLRMLPHFKVKPWCLATMTGTGLLGLVFATMIDTDFYTAGQLPFLRYFSSSAIVTPLNNVLYNIDSENLAQHGLHPFYQHAIVNLPQLIGPAFLLLLVAPRLGNLLYSAVSALVVLSCFKHQEARFLLPAVPLLLASVSIPKRWTKAFIASWVIFNVALGVLMGKHHQGGVVPAQLWISQQALVSQTFWWKTLSPPTYLLGHDGSSVVTHDLMGRPGVNMTAYLEGHIACNQVSSSLLVAPLSATFLDPFVESRYMDRTALPFTLTPAWTYTQHLNLDDMDFGDDGILPTLSRVIGRRGLGIWHINRQC